MDDLKKLRELAEQAKAEHRRKLYGAAIEALYDATGPIEDFILSLLDRVEKVEADAKRYRWLREGNPGCYNTIMTRAGQALDAAIDAQLDQQEKQ